MFSRKKTVPSSKGMFSSSKKSPPPSRWYTFRKSKPPPKSNVKKVLQNIGISKRQRTYSWLGREKTQPNLLYEKVPESIRYLLFICSILIIVYLFLQFIIQSVKYSETNSKNKQHKIKIKIITYIICLIILIIFSIYLNSIWNLFKININIKHTV